LCHHRSEKYVPPVGTSLEEYTFNVDGMSCASCDTTIRSALKGIDDIRKVAVDVSKGLVIITFGPYPHLAQSGRRLTLHRAESGADHTITRAAQSIRSMGFIVDGQ
jgi:copper chaperone CopZ